MEEKNIAVLGATGSVGTQALDVAAARGYRVDMLSASSSSAEMEVLARRFKPNIVAMADERAAEDLRVALADTSVRVLSGEEGILEGIRESSAETFINSIIGAAGLKPTLEVIEKRARLALANKESLVIAGHIVMPRAEKLGSEIIPVDSEHSAIFQSLRSGKREEIRRLILTASGGPFFGYTREMLEHVTPDDALAHPTWKMGKKITVDSATLMNKGFEVIEASYLFGVRPSDIEVTIHRESILHSAVEYIDKSVVGELSVPDMRMCVQYAVDYPQRCVSSAEPLDLFSVGKLSFARPDREAFPFLDLAERTAECGGACSAVMNASDEVAVGAFLEERISFTALIDTVCEVTERLMSSASRTVSLDDVFSFDTEARMLTSELIAKRIGRKIN